MGREGSWSWAGTHTHLTGEVDLVGGGFIFSRREHKYLVKRSSLHERAGLVCDCQGLHKVQLLSSDHSGEAMQAPLIPATPQWRGTWRQVSALGAFCHNLRFLGSSTELETPRKNVALCVCGGGVGMKGCGRVPWKSLDPVLVPLWGGVWDGDWACVPFRAASRNTFSRSPMLSHQTSLFERQVMLHPATGRVSLTRHIWGTLGLLPRLGSVNSPL